MNNLIEALDKIKEIRGINDSDIAREADLDPSSISKWRTGSRFPDRVSLGKLVTTYPVLRGIIFDLMFGCSEDANENYRQS